MPDATPAAPQAPAAAQPGSVPAVPLGGVAVAAPPGGGPTFGVEFFASVLAGRVRSIWEGAPELVPVVEFHLADGFTADICHIPVLAPAWMAALVPRQRDVQGDGHDVHPLPAGDAHHGVDVASR